MVLDTSAIFAAIANEADSLLYRDAMRDAPGLSISSVTALETRIVLHSRLGPGAVPVFDQMLEQAAILVVPFDAGMAHAAFKAFRLFGKGQGHPAQLNIIDCAAYALAKTRSEPLLFKGADFGRTDIRSALG